MDSMNTPSGQRKLTPLEAEIERGKKMRKEHYLQQARSHIALAEIYMKDTSDQYDEMDILTACEKAIDYMDAFLREDYNVTDLLTTYVEGCKAAISVLLGLKSKKVIARGIELCEKFGSKITEENSVEDKNEAILVIAQLLAALNSARAAHESAIEGFELVKRVQEIQFRRQKSGITKAMIAQSNLNLAIEHIGICDVGHYEKAMNCYIDAMILFVEDCYKGKLRIGDSLYFDHSFKEAFDEESSFNLIESLITSKENLIGALHKEMAKFKAYICDLRNKYRALNLHECVEGLMKYSDTLDRIKKLAGWKFEDIFFLQKKESCYLQISDLLLELGEFYESKKYLDLAKQVFSSTI